jgi:hypothetical protein
MIEKYIRIRIRDDGRTESVEVFTPAEIMARVFPATKPRTRLATWTVAQGDAEDVALLKRAVAAAGGPSRLSGMTGASLAAVYQWLRREAIPLRYRGQVIEIAARDGGEEDGSF